MVLLFKRILTAFQTFTIAHVLYRLKNLQTLCPLQLAKKLNFTERKRNIVLLVTQ